MTSSPVINFPDRAWIKNGGFIEVSGTPAMPCLFAERGNFFGETRHNHFKTFGCENGRTTVSRSIEESSEVGMLEVLIDIADNDPIGAAATLLPGMIIKIPCA